MGLAHQLRGNEQMSASMSSSQHGRSNHVHSEGSAAVLGTSEDPGNQDTAAPALHQASAADHCGTCGDAAVEQPAATEPGPTEDEIREDDLYPAQVDTEDRLATLECEHTAKVHEADQVEQQGLILLRKVVLLRAAITCDNRRDTFVATELRELAETLGSDPTDEALAGAVGDTPVLRLVAAGPSAPSAG
jgi:hypothetical protein